jgi:uncharacterized BrkB/YihY/UPF0761 family membrane protein
MPFRPSLDRRVYAAALHLYPPAFRREFGPEMLRDFDDAQSETWCRPGARAVFVVHIAADLARSIVWQWLRSGLPAIAVVSAAATLLSIAAISRLWPTRAMEMPLRPADRELLGLIILAIVVILLIATTIVLTIWSAPTRSLRRRRR